LLIESILFLYLADPKHLNSSVCVITNMSFNSQLF